MVSCRREVHASCWEHCSLTGQRWLRLVSQLKCYSIAACKACVMGKGWKQPRTGKTVRPVDFASLKISSSDDDGDLHCCRTPPPPLAMIMLARDLQQNAPRRCPGSQVSLVSRGRAVTRRRPFVHAQVPPKLRWRQGARVAMATQAAMSRDLPV